MNVACTCEERKKPVSERKWFVVERNYNCSAFNGYREQYSDYSGVYCTNCHSHWRTKAQYVYLLEDGDFLKLVEQETDDEPEKKEGSTDSDV